MPKPNALIGAPEKKVLHTVAGKLGLAEGAYRDILRAVAHVDSSNDMCFADYDRVMARFKELGKDYKVAVFIPSTGGKGRRFQRPVPGKRSDGMEDMASPEQQKMMFALWEDVGRVRGNPGLKAFVKARFGINALEWITKPMAGRIIEALKKMRARQ